MPTRRPAIIPPEILGAAAPVPSPSNGPDAFVDYSRVLTPEGGILITYKDANVHTLGPVLAWTFATGFAKWLIENYSPTDSLPINVGVFLLAALINWWLFCRLIAVMRSIEIRADSMIFDGEDVFWLSKIGDNWPAFQADERFKNRQVLGGIYGTRFIEYTAVYRFDELDRTPEVLASHVHDAMMKLWDDAADDDGPASPMRGRRRGY